jgi:HK97 family phage portal protein
LQLLETKQFNVLEICRFFGVHPDKVFAQQTTNYKASEMSQVSFLTDTLQPYLRQFELEFQIKLIPEKAYYSKRVDFDIEPLLQTDLNTQADYMTKTIATGVRTVNYWRMKLGQPPVEGGDKPLVSANLLPLNGEKMSQQQESQKN